MKKKIKYKYINSLIYKLQTEKDSEDGITKNGENLLKELIEVTSK